MNSFVGVLCRKECGVRVDVPQGDFRWAWASTPTNFRNGLDVQL